MSDEHDEQLDLFGPPRKRHGPPPAVHGSATSEAAAESIEPKAATLRRKVLDYLRAAGDLGATDEQMQTDLAMPANTQRPRRDELVTGRLVRDSGNTRPTKSGRSAVVWVAT